MRTSGMALQGLKACGEKWSTRPRTYPGAVKSESSSLLQGSYTYDAVGNRTAGPGLTGASALSYSYYTGKKNWLNWVSPYAGVTPEAWAFAYDTAGNLGAKAQIAPPQGQTAEQFLIGYGDDNRQQIVQHTSPSGALDFTLTAHNGLGQAVFQYATQGAITNPANRFELFQYDEAGQLLLLTTTTSAPNNAPLQEYVYLDGVPVAYFVYDANYTASGPYFIHGDHLGTPQKVTDGSGAVVVNLQRSAFGMPLATTSSVPPPRLGFPGQFSSFTGWYWFNGFREYDATLGRYLQVDPIGLAGGINTYAYADNNPLRNIDPTGTFFFPLLGVPPALAALGDAAIITGGIMAALAAGESLTQPQNEPAPTIAPQERKPGQYVCNCRAQCRGDCLKPGEDTQYGVGTASGINFPQVKNAARKAAEALISCQGKHTTCKCIDPKGQPIREGG